MGDKEVKEFNRIERATYLERLARELRTGTLDKDAANWTIPQRFGAKTGFDEKADVLVTGLSLKCTIIDDYPEAEHQGTTHRKKSFKPIQSNPNASFQKLQQAAEAGEFILGNSGITSVNF
jgi:hypothetical protein